MKKVIVRILVLTTLFAVVAGVYLGLPALLREFDLVPQKYWPFVATITPTPTITPTSTPTPTPAPIEGGEGGLNLKLDAIAPGYIDYAGSDFYDGYLYLYLMDWDPEFSMTAEAGEVWFDWYVISHPLIQEFVAAQSKVETVVYIYLIESAAKDGTLQCYMQFKCTREGFLGVRMGSGQQMDGCQIFYDNFVMTSTNLEYFGR